MGPCELSREARKEEKWDIGLRDTTSCYPVITHPVTVMGEGRSAKLSFPPKLTFAFERRFFWKPKFFNIETLL